MFARACIWLRKWWSVLAALLGAAGVALACLLGRRGADPAPPLEAARERFRERTAVSNARAAVEITAARTKNVELQAEITQALAQPDPKTQADLLIALDERVRKEPPP